LLPSDGSRAKPTGGRSQQFAVLRCLALLLLLLLLLLKIPRIQGILADDRFGQVSPKEAWS
jgi:hypothetical protein